MSRQVVELDSLSAVDAHLADTPSLSGCFVQSVDLTARSEVLRRVEVAGAVFLGCDLLDADATSLRDRGALIFPDLPGLPFDPYRPQLYSADELFGSRELVTADVPYAESLDAAIYAYARQATAEHTLAGSLATALHDHAITDALDDFMAAFQPTSVVGVMGGHALKRGTSDYAGAARLGAGLTRAGRMVLTGGGPGAMEAANLGAYLAHVAEETFEAMLTVLAPAASYSPDIDPWSQAAKEVRRQVPAAEAGQSVGIPTWFYGHEPPNQFATAIAKYFANPIREDTLLTRCRGGIVYLPGAAGTTQEIFTAATENYYAAEDQLVAPMIFVGIEHWTKTLPAWPLVSALGRDRVMGERLHLVDDVDAALALLT